MSRDILKLWFTIFFNFIYVLQHCIGKNYLPCMSYSRVMETGQSHLRLPVP